MVLAFTKWSYMYKYFIQDFILYYVVKYHKLQ